MNRRSVCMVLGRFLVICAVLFLIPASVCLLYGEPASPFLISSGIALLAGGSLWLIFRNSSRLVAKDGFLTVSLSWLLLSALGALPYVLSGDIPAYADAFFESASGFTTTGATILNDIEGMSRGCMFWRCFSHWVGGMGVLTFMLAVLPTSGSFSMHLMRAEMPGPTVGKLVPRAKKTAALLYEIYIGMTAVLVVLLLFGGMDFYDALIHAFSTAGTGGFSNRAGSIADFNSLYIEIVLGVFMLLFGVNFNLYFLMLMKNGKTAFKDDELRGYALIVLLSVLFIAWNITPQTGSFAASLRLSFFQVSSVITTTGFSTADFNLWPEFSRALLMLITALGACAGSTGGGIKVSRLIILSRAARRECGLLARPRSISSVRMNGLSVAEDTVRSTLTFFVLYVFIVSAGTLLLSLRECDIVTAFTSMLTCLSNVGPGLNLVGPAGNFSFFSAPIKYFLSLVMITGRLEIIPVLMLFSSRLLRSF